MPETQSQIVQSFHLQIHDAQVRVYGQFTHFAENENIVIRPVMARILTTLN